MSAARLTIPGLRSTQEAPESGLLDDLTTDRRTRGTAAPPCRTVSRRPGSTEPVGGLPAFKPR